jgi:uncharacterized protein (TIGR02271 family)
MEKRQPAAEQIVLAEEQLEVNQRQIERGRVIVRVHVDERVEIAETSLRQEEAVVERVALNKVVDAAPAVREEDGVLIVPVLEEQIVVQKRLILKEELRITLKSRSEVSREPVRLRSERAQVERVKASAPNTNPNQGIDDE